LKKNISLFFDVVLMSNYKSPSKKSSKHKMSSKQNRRKRPQVAKTENLDHIKAYQIVDGFTRCPVAADGNCFYTATGFFCGLNAAEMRQLVMKFFIFKKAEYSIFFESENDFMKAVRHNTTPKVWNSELCDIAPHAMAQLLKRAVIIHNYDGKTITVINTPVDQLALYPPIHLFRSNHHYEILLENSKKPNKNIYPLPDVSEFSDVIDLTFSDTESDEEEEPEIIDDDSESEKNDDKCLIRI
jgi:hypothetical protein